MHSPVCEVVQKHSTARFLLAAMMQMCRGFRLTLGQMHSLLVRSEGSRKGGCKSRRCKQSTAEVYNSVSLTEPDLLQLGRGFSLALSPVHSLFQDLAASLSLLGRSGMRTSLLEGLPGCPLLLLCPALRPCCFYALLLHATQSQLVNSRACPSWA